MSKKRIAAVLLACLMTLAPTMRDARAKAQNLSQESLELKTLYEELLNFKDKPEFHQVGFGTCCQFHDWLEKVEAVGEKTGIELLKEVGFVAGELGQLGREYMKSKGRETEYSLYMRKEIEAGFAAIPDLKAGQGMIITQGVACYSIESFRLAESLMLDKNYGGAAEVYESPDCITTYSKTVVSEPLETQKLNFSTFIRVGLSDGSKVWLSFDDVDFNFQSR